MENNKKIAIYKTKDNKIKLEVHLEKETIWLDQKSIANLFNVNIPAISKHISNIYEENELAKRRTFSIRK